MDNTQPFAAKYGNTQPFELFWACFVYQITLGYSTFTPCLLLLTFADDYCHVSFSQKYVSFFAHNNCSYTL